MKKNVGTIDRRLRVLIALVIVVLFTTKVITGTLAIALAIVGFVLIITGFTSFCPLYRVLGVNTCPLAKKV